MSDQSQTTANTPADPVLCKMGCGFFGNSATGGCCSKCWRDQQKKEGVDNITCVPVTKKAQPETPVAPTENTQVPPTDSKSSQEAKVDDAKSASNEGSVAPKKKKGKKKSYKSMMAGMMSTQANSGKAEKEKEALRKVTGGGAFSKVEKI